MLAAAGGADVHPHRDSPPADRARWDADVARFDDDLRTLDRFFLDVLDGRIDADEATRRAREFYGVQGPWYTVGWRMAATIEEELGRQRLVDVICDPPLVLAAYREAAEARARRTGMRPAVWSERLLAGLTATTR
jgi:hypothetical protein